MMTNEIEKLKSQLAKTEKPSSTSLLSRVKSTQIAREKCILIDLSGSMAEITSNGASKYELVQRIMPEFAEFTKFGFSSNCIEIKGSKLPLPGGSTQLDRAFIAIRDRFKKLILITDGKPNSEYLAMEASFDLTIDVIYIGNPPTPTFLTQLAARSGGKFVAENLMLTGNVNLLENKIKGLLL